MLTFEMMSSSDWFYCVVRINIYYINNISTSMAVEMLIAGTGSRQIAEVGY